MSFVFVGEGYESGMFFISKLAHLQISKLYNYSFGSRLNTTPNLNVFESGLRVTPLPDGTK